jgi:hypothetical protein
MPLSVWLPLLVRNRFAVTRVGQALRQTLFSVGNSFFHRIDQLAYGSRIARRPAPLAPLFVVGHWRTGTTLLHELLVLDPQFSYPTTYQVMAPHHFVLTQSWVPRWLRHAVPAQRPMDAMEMGFDKPQEDEFALCNLGLPSPCLRWAFPRHYREPGLYLDIEALSERERRRWCDGMENFIRRLAWCDARRTVLKSPTHTARITTLAKLFPGAQFIHIVRNPFEVFASTVHTWRQMWDALGFQSPRFDDLEEYVLATLNVMYRNFDSVRATLPPEQFHELHYEELINDPVDQMRCIYERLQLGEFAGVQSKIEAYFAAKSAYRTNRHELSADLRRKVAARWRDYCKRYGYDVH